MYRYSWFITRYSQTLDRDQSTDDWYLDSVNSLFLGDTDQLSPVGILYNSL